MNQSIALRNQVQRRGFGASASTAQGGTSKYYYNYDLTYGSDEFGLIEKYVHLKEN
jgi:hypothetical protein